MARDPFSISSTYDPLRTTSAAGGATDELFELPFVGREEHVLRIERFGRVARNGDRLVLLWLQGEAGIGKSRLLDEALAKLDHDDLLIIRTRLYPDASTSLVAALIAPLKEAATRLGAELPLVTDQTTLLSLLRRLLRLRPTLLVLEDLHLLDAEGINELGLLLHGLENEPLGIICSARPGADEALGVALPVTVSTIELAPLTLDGVRQMGYLLDYNPLRRDTLTRMLHKVSGGLPLVISTIRKYILTRRDELAANPVAFIRKIARETVRSITDGLMAGLPAHEKQAAARLALLGEIFAAETAARFVPNAGPLLRQLRASGVLTRPLTGTPPLMGPPVARERFVFTHSLLHERLREEAEIPSLAELFALFEADVPLFSVLPFSLLLETTDLTVEPERLERGIGRVLELASILSKSPNHGLTTTLLDGVERLLRVAGSDIDEARLAGFRLAILETRLRALSFWPAHHDYGVAVDTFLQATADPQDEQTALRRFTALEYDFYRSPEMWRYDAKMAIDEIERLTGRFPDILLKERTITFIALVVASLRVRGGDTQTERMRGLLDRVLEGSKRIGDAAPYRMALAHIAPGFLPLFTSPQELADRHALSEMILREFEGSPPTEGRWMTAWPQFLMATGDFRRLRTHVDLHAPRPISWNDVASGMALRLYELMGMGGLGVPLRRIERAALGLLHEYEELGPPPPGLDTGAGVSMAQMSVISFICAVSLLRNEPEWGLMIERTICDGRESNLRFRLVERAAARGDREKLARLLEDGEAEGTFRPLVAWIADEEGATLESAYNAARAVLAVPFFRKEQLYWIHTLLSLVDMIDWSEIPSEEYDVLCREAHDKVLTTLEWCAERDLAGFIGPLLEKGGTWLSEREREAWRRRHQEIVARLHHDEVLEAEEEIVEEETSIRLSMLGKIAVDTGDGDWKRISGARAKRLLGLLVTNELADSRLTLVELRSLATGMDDPKDAANYLRIMISRLRKIMGRDAILTVEGEGPQLNVDMVGVDLLEVIGLLRRTIALAPTQLLQSCETFEQAIGMIGKSEPYPGLNDPIFRAARHEFRSLVAEATTLLVRLLRRRGDERRATAMLGVAMQIAGDDERLRQLAAGS